MGYLVLFILYDSPRMGRATPPVGFAPPLIPLSAVAVER